MPDKVAPPGASGQREHFTGDEDLVFCTTGGMHLGYKSLKDRYRGALKTAGLREDFRFHNLRHTFGSTVIRHADSREVMEWMGHADLMTTRRSLAFVDREDAARWLRWDGLALASVLAVDAWRQEDRPGERAGSGGPGVRGLGSGRFRGMWWRFGRGRGRP
jgi:hypothetical protein